MLSDNKTTKFALDDWFDEIDVDQAALKTTSDAANGSPTAGASETATAVVTATARREHPARQPATTPTEVVVDQQEVATPVVGRGAHSSRTRRRPSLLQLREGMAWRSTASARWVSEHRGGVAVSVAAAVIGSALVAAIVVVLSAATTVGDEPTGDIAAIASTTSVAEQPNWCATGTRGTTVTGNGSGSATSGPEAVLAFEAAYYHSDVGGARAMIAPTSTAAPENSLRQAVAALPKNVSHCVAITPARDMGLSADPNTFHVSITERDPNGAQRTWEQLVTTTNLGNPRQPAWRITQFAPVPTTQKVPR